IGTDYVKAAAPDGHTLLFAAGEQFSLRPSVVKNLNYTIDDFVTVANVMAGSYVLMAHPSFPAKTLGELIDLAKAQPGKVAYASSGIGSTQHLAMELLAT